MGRCIFVTGIWLQLCGVIGMVATTFDMLQSIKAMGVTFSSDPSKLIGAVGGATRSTMLGLIGNFVGTLLMLYALWTYRLRERWMFTWSLAIGVLLIPLSLPLLVFCLMKRHEFSKVSGTRGPAIPDLTGRSYHPEAGHSRFHQTMSPISPSQLIDSLNWRYATKAFDPNKKIPADIWSALEKSLVLTPSSYGLQPWKFLVITDKALRESLVPHAWNQRQIADCSHLVVMLAKKTVGEADIDKLIHRIAEVRGGTADALAAYKSMMMGSLTQAAPEFIIEWAKKQTYIALGQFMGAAATLGIDTCPMEGFVAPKFDEILGLNATDYTTSVLCPAGYRSADDKYAVLPKVRFKAEDVIEHR
ncbi:MAG: NAD(P)H-dependent oxidoreductase [Verrucomicrobiaceae bacterium]